MSLKRIWRSALQMRIHPRGFASLVGNSSGAHAMSTRKKDAQPEWRAPSNERICEVVLAELLGFKLRHRPTTNVLGYRCTHAVMRVAKECATAPRSPSP